TRIAGGRDLRAVRRPQQDPTEPEEPLAAEPDQTAAPAKRGPVPLALATVAALPGLYLGLAELFHLGHPEFAPPLLALTYGVAVIGAAFVLAWAAEAAQLDVSA